jgi:hypothetical protein
LRHLRNEAAKQGGSIVIGGGYTAQSVALGSLDLETVLSVLIERDELFLASFNIKIERP